MSTPPATHSLLSGHTFGRHHTQPPPLPVPLQQGQASNLAQMAGDAPPAVQAQAGHTPCDLDHLVRSIGEW
ncbi:hypothetical protein AX13_01735 [Comamonas aquatica DA1877]|uniref:Uncharacterized protein n=1 Tax=Comamonas aquatica DA1877 TaxID=1457173 RepID=A0A014NKY9_9BURK|nr:hypothetical protein [Comamonas aquatica]EXU80123.1 hypothetical protein AX13_01735 [Comamonas aquatica DA1877]